MYVFRHKRTRIRAYVIHIYVSRGAQTGIIKNSLPGLSLVIDDLMHRLISSVEGPPIASASSFFARVYRVYLTRLLSLDGSGSSLPRGDATARRAFPLVKVY